MVEPKLAQKDRSGELAGLVGRRQVPLLLQRPQAVARQHGQSRPPQYDRVKYDLVRIAYDVETDTWGADRDRAFRPADRQEHRHAACQSGRPLALFLHVRLRLLPDLEAGERPVPDRPCGPAARGTIPVSASRDQQRPERSRGRRGRATAGGSFSAASGCMASSRGCSSATSIPTARSTSRSSCRRRTPISTSPASGLQHARAGHRTAAGDRRSPGRGLPPWSGNVGFDSPNHGDATRRPGPARLFLAAPARVILRAFAPCATKFRGACADLVLFLRQCAGWIPSGRLGWQPQAQLGDGRTKAGVCTLFASNHPQGLPALRLPPAPTKRSRTLCTSRGSRK